MKQDKLQSVLDTAGRMFARYGLRKTSIEEMARLARVAKATIYNYFGNKDQVYLEVLRREMGEILDYISSSVAKEASPIKKLGIFIKAKFRSMRSALNILNMDRDGVENILPGAEGIRNELFDREVDIICAILKEGMKRGIFFLNYPVITARAIAHALRGFELNWLVNESDEKIDHYLEELMSILFYGLMSQKRESSEDLLLENT